MDLTNQRVVFYWNAAANDTNPSHRFGSLFKRPLSIKCYFKKQISWFVVSILSRCLMILSIQKKEQTARDLIALGHEITILSEVEFYALISQQLKEWQRYL